MADKWLADMVDEITAKETELVNLKRAANAFFRSKELPPPYADTDVETPTAGTAIRLKPDEFYGRGFATAVRNYLERRKQAVTAEEAFQALEQGGFDFDAIGWQNENRPRSVAMSLSKNTAIFHRLPNGMFGLRDWYPDAIERKSESKDRKGKKRGKNGKSTTKGKRKSEAEGTEDQNEKATSE